MTKVLTTTSARVFTFKRPGHDIGHHDFQILHPVFKPIEIRVPLRFCDTQTERGFKKVISPLHGGFKKYQSVALYLSRPTRCTSPRATHSCTVQTAGPTRQSRGKWRVPASHQTLAALVSLFPVKIEFSRRTLLPNLCTAAQTHRSAQKCWIP